jgi:hypothetical protein
VVCSRERTSGSVNRNINIFLQRETEDKARQPETKLGAIAHTRHKARLSEDERKTQKPHGAQNRP